MARSALLAAVCMAVSLLGPAHGAEVTTQVGNAPPQVVSWGALPAGSACGPGDSSFSARPGEALVCVRARDGNGHPDLCAPGALRRASLALVGPSGRAWAGSLSCAGGEGRDAWLAAVVPAAARAGGALHLHLEDAWGAGVDATGVLPPASGQGSTLPPRAGAGLLP